MSSSCYSNESYVTVFPFSRQHGNEDTVIGRSGTNTFLALEPSTVQILDDLAEGKTIGEARALYLERHGEDPDLEEFLELLAAKGFVHPGRGSLAAAEIPSSLPAVRTHFDGIPVGVARLFFGPWALGLYGLVIAAAAWALYRDPSLFPGRRSLYFESHHTLKILGVVLFSFVTLFFHEMAHLLAARAAGVKARLGIGNRLWIIVAETDMTGLWAEPKRRRYLPLLAGPLIDLTSASLLVGVLAAERAGFFALPPLAMEMLRAIFYAYLFQFVWQFFFFVRTDFYYVIATAFDCKNLLGDTETYLRNRWAPRLQRLPKWRFLPTWKIADQSHISPRELRLIWAYSWIWMLGRGVAIALLALITLPVTWAYLQKVGSALRAGFSADAGNFVDSAILVGIFGLLWVWGIGTWLNQLRQSWKKH